VAAPTPTTPNKTATIVGTTTIVEIMTVVEEIMAVILENNVRASIGNLVRRVVVETITIRGTTTNQIKTTIVTTGVGKEIKPAMATTHRVHESMYLLGIL